MIKKTFFLEALTDPFILSHPLAVFPTIAFSFILTYLHQIESPIIFI